MQFFDTKGIHLFINGVEIAGDTEENWDTDRGVSVTQL